MDRERYKVEREGKREIGTEKDIKQRERERERKRDIEGDNRRLESEHREENRALSS